MKVQDENAEAPFFSDPLGLVLRRALASWVAVKESEFNLQP